VGNRRNSGVVGVVALFSGPGAWDLLAGLILLVLAGFSLPRRGWRRLPLAVLLVGVAIALFTIGGRAMLTRYAVTVRTPHLPAGGQAVSGVRRSTGNSGVAWPKTTSLPRQPVGPGQAVAAGENCYVTGYAPQTAAHVHVLYYECGRSAYLNDYVAGGADMPGVRGRRGVSSLSLPVPLNGLPGGGVGPVLPAGNAAWPGLPFSRASILMGPA
jgi:hypothetical protein